MGNREEQILQQMLSEDQFSQWLGIEVLEMGAGRCKLQMTVRDEMTNGFNIAHGGITYSLADSAFAFASNSRGRKAVSIETSINHVMAVKSGDLLIAEASEESMGNKTGVYRIIVSNGQGDRVAIFKGMVYRTGQEW